MIGQGIDISPQINVPISVGLGSLPVVLGAFVASGAAFLVGWQVPGIRAVTNIIGIGLAAFGIVNVFLPKGPGAPDDSGSITPAGGQGGSISPPIQATEEEAFQQLEGRVVSPAEWQTIDLSPFSSSVPIRIRVSNPAQNPITFDLLLNIHESPTPVGAEMDNTTSQRVTVGPGETRDVDVTIPLLTWGWAANQIDIDLRVGKRRISGGESALLDLRSFKVD
jgi:hypothetical protein